jgi:hypothetical protein
MNADSQSLAAEAAVPRYLAETYWWAYLHPKAVHLFERQWLVNLILWGNFGRLRDAAIAALGVDLHGRTLQVACVYGDLTRRIAGRLAQGAELHVVDVLRVQLDNLARKLPVGLLNRRGHEAHERAAVKLIQGDSAALELVSASYDRALLFFLLHEQPDPCRGVAGREAGRPHRDRRLPPAAPAQSPLLADDGRAPDARAVRSRPVAQRAGELASAGHRHRGDAQADFLRWALPAGLDHGLGAAQRRAVRAPRAR